jgi:uncharacterized membrane protein HdeD (DUF308 family)
MSRTPEYFAESHSVGRTVEKPVWRWRWPVAFGGLCALFGALAPGLVEATSLAVVFLIALMLIVAGGAEILLGYDSRDWPSFFLWLISGLFYLVFGAFALARPEVAVAAPTAVVGAGLLFAGLARIWLGLKLPAGPKAFVVLAGVIATLFSGLILAGWPGNMLIILGTLFGVDLVFMVRGGSRSACGCGADGAFGRRALGLSV